MRTKGRYRIDLSTLLPLEDDVKQTIVDKGLFNVLNPFLVRTGTSGYCPVPPEVDISLYNLRYKVDERLIVFYPLVNINFITQSTSRDGWEWSAEIEIYNTKNLTIIAHPYEIGNRTGVYGMKIEFKLINKEV